jgi:hypothetical protein
MKLSIKQGSENYACTVVEIDKLFPIEGADKIQRALILNNDVIVSKDVKIGDKMLYFVSGTKLNSEYCKYNNLFTDKTLNKDTEKTGYISPKQCRVKAIKLRGVISDGILMPLESLVNFYNGIETTETGKLISINYGSDINVLDFKDRDSFNYIKDTLICEKYIVKESRNSNPGGKQPKVAKFNRLIDNQFYFHGSTDNLRKNMHKINPDDIIGIHYKKHGTSAVFANIPTLRPLKWWEKILVKLGVKIDNKIYDIIYSSRTVVKNKSINLESGGGFYGEDVWKVVADEIGDLIPKNWTIYGEILGYTPKGAAIQKGYDYGCDPHKSEHKFYVYKISVVNPDGKVIYLTDKQIEEYCEKVGLLYSDTFIYYGKAENLIACGEAVNKQDNADCLNVWRGSLLTYLEKEYNEKDCYMCTNKVPEEGIVLRVEKLESYEAYKLKSKRFILAESDAQEKGESNLEDEN